MKNITITLSENTAKELLATLSFVASVPESREEEIDHEPDSVRVEKALTLSKEAEAENLVIRDFRKRFMPEIDMILGACAKTDWPHHQVARVIYNICGKWGKSFEEADKDLRTVAKGVLDDVRG